MVHIFSRSRLRRAGIAAGLAGVLVSGYGASPAVSAETGVAGVIRTAGPDSSECLKTKQFPGSSGGTTRVLGEQKTGVIGSTSKFFGPQGGNNFAHSTGASTLGATTSSILYEVRVLAPMRFSFTDGVPRAVDITVKLGYRWSATISAMANRVGFFITPSPKGTASHQEAVFLEQRTGASLFDTPVGDDVISASYGGSLFPTAGSSRNLSASGDSDVVHNVTLQFDDRIYDFGIETLHSSEAANGGGFDESRANTSVSSAIKFVELTIRNAEYCWA